MTSSEPQIMFQMLFTHTMKASGVQNIDFHGIDLLQGSVHVAGLHAQKMKPRNRPYLTLVV